MTVAVDSTGFSCSNASRHFVKRMQEFGNMEYSVHGIRGYSKATLAVDADTLIVLAMDVGVSNMHNVKHIPKTIEDIVSARYDVSNVLADKAYDADWVHESIRA